MIDHQQRHDRMGAVTRTSVVSAVVNLVLTMVKVVVGLFANSQALIADGIHSLSDLLSDLLVWVAGRHATQAPDEEHPYGHGRLETLATLILGVLLIGVGVGIGWDATDRLFHPAELPQPGMLALW
ncbi:MAG TPA: cation diffusion facilitator family transporter, partial [Chromatiaceae bacterium]|nr:cation diffusion facilitator family transporter [Chromatiaceae bacterium]